VPDTTHQIRPDTFAAQAGGQIDETTGAVVPPVHVATTFERDPDNAYSKGYIYGRDDNPTVRQCEEVITRLEDGAASLVVSSGMSAATTLFLSLDRPAHIVAPTVMYWGLRKWLVETAPQFGIETTLADATDTEAIASAIIPGRTRLVWLETPSNPLWDITDLGAVAQAAHAAGATVAVDSTAASPVITRPLSLGADIVMHAATKYLNGHSDVVAGALTFADAEHTLAQRAKHLRAAHGTILGPFEAAMLLRGMRTLYVRVAHQCRTASAIATHFRDDPRLIAVLYPGLTTHPGHDLAARQMPGGFGGMLSLRCRDETHAIETAARLKVWKRATSLGGVESLVEHRASVEGPASPCPPDLLRLSTGLENEDDLINDLDRALGVR